MYFFEDFFSLPPTSNLNQPYPPFELSDSLSVIPQSAFPIPNSQFKPLCSLPSDFWHLSSVTPGRKQQATQPM